MAGRTDFELIASVFYYRKDTCAYPWNPDNNPKERKQNHMKHQGKKPCYN